MSYLGCPPPVGRQVGTHVMGDWTGNLHPTCPQQGSVALKMAGDQLSGLCEEKQGAGAASKQTINALTQLSLPSPLYVPGFAL